MQLQKHLVRIRLNACEGAGREYPRRDFNQDVVGALRTSARDQSLTRSTANRDEPCLGLCRPDQVELPLAFLRNNGSGTTKFHFPSVGKLPPWHVGIFVLYAF